MSAEGAAVSALLAAGVVVEILAVVGTLVLRSTLDRAHMLGPAAILGPLLIVAAIVVHEHTSPLGVKALLVLVVLWFASPVLGHATARATVLRARREGRDLAGTSGLDV